MGTQNSDQTDQAYSFTKTELERLAVYRSALAAGFYTDSCVGTGDGRDCRLDWLADRGVDECPFSQAELRRMATYKQAVAIGFYTDGLEGG